MNIFERLTGLSASEVLEWTFVAIILLLVLSRPQAFSSVMRSISGAYTSSVQVLQGR